MNKARRLIKVLSDRSPGVSSSCHSTPSWRTLSSPSCVWPEQNREVKYFLFFNSPPLTYLGNVFRESVDRSSDLPGHWDTVLGIFKTFLWGHFKSFMLKYFLTFFLCGRKFKIFLSEGHSTQGFPWRQYGRWVCTERIYYG